MPHSARLRIRTLLPLLIGAVMIIGSLLFIALRRSREFSHVRQVNAEILELQIFECRNSLSNLLISGQKELAERRFLDEILDPRLQVMVVADENGKVLFSNRRQWLGQSCASVEGFVPGDAARAKNELQSRFLPVRKTRLTGYLPLELGLQSGTLRESRQGLLFVTYDLKPNFEAADQRLLVDAAWILGYCVMLLLLLGLLLEVWITRKIDRLVRTMREVEGGNLQARSCLKGSGELARLGQVFDQLLDRMVGSQRELKESQEFLDKILENLPLMLFVKDAKDLRFVRFNKAGEELLGYPREELLGKNDFDFFPPDQAESFTREDRAVLEGGQLLDIPEEPIQTHLQGERILHTLKVPVNGQDGQPLYLMGISEDITDRKRTEVSLRKAEAALEQSPVIMIVTDTHGCIEYVNAAFTRTTGYSAAEALGQNPRFLKSGEQSPAFYEDLWKTLVQGRTWQGRLRNRKKDGSLYWESATISPLVDASGKITHYVAAKEDITEALRLEEEHLRLEQQVAQAQKMESLGSLAGGVAHDMNNVLAAIMALATMHREAAPEGSSLQKGLDTITNACVRGGTLVKGLLGFARQGLTEERILDLNALVHDEVALLERTTLKRIHLEMDLASELRSIKGDPSALTHALMNLCVNAVDAMPEGGNLTLRTRNEDPSWVRLEVVDTGIGMPESVMQKALDPFFTTKPQGKGTGLGLPMVYSTVKAHQGQMEIRSIPGSGTTVVVRLPACEGAQDVKPAGDAPATEQRALRILVVDDDEVIQQITSDLLKALGHLPTVVGRGEEALASLEEGLAADLVILDLNMPGLGGALTLPRIRALRANLPVFLATGRPDQQAMDLVAAVPNTLLLAKPFSLKDLAAHLKNLN